MTVKNLFEKKLIGSFAIILLSVLALAYITYRTNQTNEDTFYWVRHTQQVLFLSENIFSNVKDLERRSRGYILTGDKAFLENAGNPHQVIMNNSDSLKKLTADNPIQQKRIDSLKYVIDEKLRFIQATITAGTRQGFEEAKNLVASKEGLKYMNEVDRLTKAIQAEENRLLQIREKANQESTTTFMLLFISQTVVLIVIIVTFAVMLFLNLRARKKAEKELSESKQTIQSIINNTTSFIYIKDKQGHYKLMNKALLSFLSRSQADVIDKTDFDFFPAEMASSNYAYEKEVLVQKKVLEREESYEYNGHRNHYYSVKFPLWDAEGEIMGTGGIITNITNVILEQKLHRQKQIAESTIEAQEKQRKVIAEELHDNVQQLLASANLMLDMAVSNSEMQQVCLAKSKEGILAAISEVRKISHSMIAPQFSEKPLTQAIEELTENINLAGNIYALLTVREEKEINALSDNIKLALYRITQEQVSNILKYAKAKEMEIELKLEAKAVSLSISDNGQGFNPESQLKGIGLKNMASRAEFLDGSMEIISAPRQGCTLHVKIPV